MKIQTYGSQTRLLNNQRYNVSFSLRGQQRDFTFTSRYSPLFSSVKVLRNDFAELFQGISDDRLNFFIWQSSQLAVELMTEVGGDTDTVTFAMKQYARYKSEHDIIRAILIAYGSAAGMHEKFLGEFKISKEIKTPEIEAILAGLKEEIRRWETSMDISPRVGGAVRAGATVFPLNARVSF